MLEDATLSELFQYWLEKEKLNTEKPETLVSEFDNKAKLFTRNAKVYITFSDGSKHEHF
tara:strand:+ start:2152 stop:2328 length:177 start_codon:yes stop_codon:yes gene_type:complete